MAIKVVGQDTSVYKRVTCRKCGAILEYTPNDVQQRTVADYGGGRDVFRYIPCGGCPNEVAVTSY